MDIGETSREEPGSRYGPENELPPDLEYTESEVSERVGGATDGMTDYFTHYDEYSLGHGAIVEPLAKHATDGSPGSGLCATDLEVDKETRLGQSDIETKRHARREQCASREDESETLQGQDKRASAKGQSHSESEASHGHAQREKRASRAEDENDTLQGKDKRASATDRGHLHKSLGQESNILNGDESKEQTLDHTRAHQRRTEIHPHHGHDNTSKYVKEDPKSSLEATAGEACDGVNLNRQELREPDGASDPSSAPSSPVTSPVRDGQSESEPLIKESGPGLSARTRKGSIDGITPIEQKIERTDKPSKTKSTPTDIPYIPNTNIAVACLVTLCFNLPLGAVAIYFSLMAAKAYRDRQPKTGAKRAKISIYISLFSIVLSVLVVMAVVLLLAMKGQMRQKRRTGKTSLDF